MTLVLTALTPTHIVQVSDRRVVRRWPSGRIETTDGKVKAIVTSVFSCSYTGAAELGAGDTGEWIAITLSDHVGDGDGGLEALRAAATAELQAKRVVDQPLAIACAGWTPAAGAGAAVPLLVLATNFDISIGFDHRFSATWPELRVFELRPKPSRTTLVFPIGQPLRIAEMVAVNRALRRLSESGRATSRSIAQLLRETVRGVARSAPRSEVVSEDVLVTALPRPDLLRLELVVGKLANDVMSVTRIAPGDTRVEEQGGALIVGNGGVIQALTPEDGPPDPNGVSAAGRWVRVPERDGASMSFYVLTNPPLGPAWGFPGGS